MDKEKRSKDQIIEIIVAVLLGVTALATAWASWIGSLHGGNQATNYTTSNNLSAEGNSEWNEASQMLMQDMMTWNTISDIYIDMAYAEEKVMSWNMKSCPTSMTHYSMTTAPRIFRQLSSGRFHRRNGHRPLSIHMKMGRPIRIPILTMPVRLLRKQIRCWNREKLTTRTEMPLIW